MVTEKQLQQFIEDGFLTIDTQDGFQKWMDDEEAKLKEQGDNSGWN